MPRARPVRTLCPGGTVVRKLAGLLSILLFAGCFGRSSRGEVHLRDDAPPASTPGDLSLALYESTGVALLPGNDVRWVNDGAVFDALIADVDRAKVSINVVTFIWSDGEASRRLLDAIAPRVKAGAKCRLLIDSVGTLNPSPEFRQKLHDAGCEVRWMRPVPGQDDAARDHRKIAIVDGRIGYTGGFGIDDKWLGNGLSPKEWRDSAARAQGPVVAQMQQAFAENWQEAGGGLLPPEEFPELAPAGKARAAFVASTNNSVVTRADRLMQLLLASAKHRVWIQNAYFVPSEPILGKLANRAKEGLDVRVLTAGAQTDTPIYLPPQRARLADLEQSGVKAWEYVPAMMHAKTVLVDERLAAVGSCNLDALSLNKLDEGMLVVDDPAFARALAAQWKVDLTHARELKPGH